jgi:hypothetical protein
MSLDCRLFPSCQLADDSEQASAVGFIGKNPVRGSNSGRFIQPTLFLPAERTGSQLTRNMGLTLPVTLGLLALLSTIAIICIDVIFAVYLSTSSPLRMTSLVSASLEVVVWATLVSFLATAVSNSFQPLLNGWSSGNLEIAFGYGFLICVTAAAVSVANAIHVVKATDDLDEAVLGLSKDNFPIASLAVLGGSVACQLVFLTVYLLTCRRARLDWTEPLHTADESRRLPNCRVKPVPYSQARPLTTGIQSMKAFDSADTTSLSGRNYPAQSIGSPQSSLSEAIRPILSKARLPPIREEHRHFELDSDTYRNSIDENADSRGIYSVDRHGRRLVLQTLLETSSPTCPKQRFVETMTARPTIAENAKFDSSLDLKPLPPTQQRSQSCSPVARRPKQPAQTLNIVSDQLHIHPLFRSDSPTPQPAATPETIIVAPPNARMVITHHSNNQSLRRIWRCSLTSTEPIK